MEQLHEALDSLIHSGIELGKNILAAILIFIVGKFVIKLIIKIISKALERSDSLEVGVKTFIGSLVKITLMILLGIAIISTLGIETTSFAALLASAGIAIGAALSGNLQNFAGGFLILLLKPFKVGDFIEAEGVSGTVRAIQMFNTVINTSDNKKIIIPNGSLSSSVIINYSEEENRRLDFCFGVEYGTDFNKVKTCLEKLVAADKRILKTPAPLIALEALADSSVNIKLRVWTKNSDYWGVNFDMNKNVYETFNKEGIGFPFPTVTVHQA